MGKISGEEGWISLGQWGGNGGVYSTYKPDGPIMQITIRHGDVIDSILFESKSRDDIIIGRSVKLGGTGGGASAKSKISAEEGWISLGPWGGKAGIYSTYKSEGSIMQITICYGEVIDSILFESKSRDGVVIGSSVKIGGVGGNASAKERIIREEGWISLGPWGGKGGVYSIYKSDGHIMQITIVHGNVIDSILFESKSRDGVVIGRSVKIGGTGGGPSKGKIRVEEGWISLGPWGGNDGVDWTYKANGSIMQISICYGQAIDSILFESKTYDGVLIGSSEKIGGTGGHVTEMV
ncbi:hypothetical protein RHSIM_Rhsim02G0161900 [Rhododendron simsii]|uniref:Jacalin-type lectin domain-containing protein n=1 Tax=Rhododendron simsii TaxID=118357 RepID=A0A834LVR0_RHOSS|nr:hypothetical protein RHSIM_Rhsim02G0161900 [Rhododendron simsii]